MSTLIRLQNNVPPYCIEQSRDFQLFCRLFDSTINGVRSDISSITNILDASKVKDRFLPLLATRVGFFTDKNIDAKVLRYILAAFPYIIKNKGTKLGIEQAVYTILKAENSSDPPYVDINNTVAGDLDASYTIDIYTPIKLFNEIALKELLKYIIPSGYKYNIILYKAHDNQGHTQLLSSDNVSFIKSPTYVASSVRNQNNIKDYYNKSIDYNGGEPSEEAKALINAFDMQEVVGVNQFKVDDSNKAITQIDVNEFDFESNENTGGIDGE